MYLAQTPKSILNPPFQFHISSLQTSTWKFTPTFLLAPHVKKSGNPTCSHSSSSSSPSHSSCPCWIDMGCGTSTLLSDNAAIQAKVRPIIRRRIDHIKRRRDLQKSSTPSKKELLAVDDCEKMSSVNNDSLGSKSKSIPTEDSVELKASKIVPVLEEEEEEEEEEKGSVNAEGVKKIEEVEKHEDDKTEHDAEEIREEENEAEMELEEHDDDDDDDGRCISPGSPSFRFYCVEAVPHDTDDDDDQECHSESPTKKLQNPESAEELPASPESSAEADLPQRNPETRNNPKRKINKKIRSVMNKGGQVKSLLKVKSCYNPRCSGTNHRHDKAHLLQEATAAA